jgi:chitodextrinase
VIVSQGAGAGIMRCRRFGAACLVLVSITVLLVASSRPTPAHAATQQRFVQKRFAQITSGDRVRASFRAPNAAGNLIVVYVVWDNDGAVAVTDTGGNAYVSAVGPTQPGGGGAGSAQVFYARGVIGGTNTVTADFAAPITSRGALLIHEYQGMDRVSPLDAAVAAWGSSSSMDSGPVATARADELLFAAGESNGTTVTLVTPGYRARFLGHGYVTADATAVRAGTHRIRATQNGTSWALQLVAFKSAGSSPPAYPLKVGPTGRYLVDQNDAPVLLTGDSPQALMVNLSEADADAFFADRQAAGFNAVWINLLCGPYTGGRVDDSTYDGIVPFTTPDDLATPNEAYFARIDDMLTLAAQHQLTVLLDPAETGSFLSVLAANGVAKSRDYGRYLGTRYRGFDNIVWMSGNDFQSWPTAGDDAVVQAVVAGIQDTDDRHIHTVELDYPVSGSLDDASWGPLIQLNASYTYYPTYAQVLADYDRPNAIPTFLVEANYEFEHNVNDEGTPQILRRQEYWSLLSGAAGQFYGNHYTWPFIGGWQEHLDTPASMQMAHVTSLLASRPWYNLIPDQAHTVVTAGYGTFSEGGALGDNDYLTAARTPDGALVMAFMPTIRTITVDMSTLGAPAYASWYDPTTGTSIPVAGSPFPNGGSRDFTPPGPNGDGDGDWVLVLEAPGVPPDTEAPSIPTGLAALAIGDTQATLTWTPSTDNVAVAGYRVLRDGTLVGSTRSTTFTDTGLSPVTTYSYAVEAFDFAGNVSGLSTPLDVTTTPPAPSFVQEGYAAPQSPQIAVSATYSGAQTAGDTNIVAIGWNDAISKVRSVTDSAGNVYRRALPTFRGNGLGQAIYEASNVAPTGPGGTVVTVTFDRAATFVDLRITEYAGLEATAPFDAGVSATGTGTNAATP